MNATFPDASQLDRMTAKFAPTPLSADTSHLTEGDRGALRKLIEAARVVDDIFLQQLWAGNEQLYSQLRKDQTPLGRARLQLFEIYKSPWSELDGHRAFMPGVPERKPLGANFYPEDLTREQFDNWIAKLPSEQAREAKGFFTVIRRGPDSQLHIVPYFEAYERDLRRAAALLQEAASLTSNDSLKKFLELRANAFLNDDYYQSDLAWMNLDAPIDLTIGPYETYNDELFG